VRASQSTSLRRWQNTLPVPRVGFGWKEFPHQPSAQTIAAEILAINVGRDGFDAVLARGQVDM